MVIDLGSSKEAVLQVMAALPSRFDPLGGHPMCGKETGTLANADAGLYRHAPFAFVPCRAQHLARNRLHVSWLRWWALNHCGWKLLSTIAVWLPPAIYHTYSPPHWR